MIRPMGASVVLLLLIAVPLWIVSCLHVMVAMPPWWMVAHGAAALAAGGALLACGSGVRVWWRERQALGLLQRARQPCPLDLASCIGDVVALTEVYLLVDPTPTALCAGLFRPAIYFSTGLIDRVPISALRAALAHEEAHRQRRDPLRRFGWTVLAEVLLPTLGIRELAGRLRLHAELIADQRARRVTSTRDLAVALLAVVAVVPPPHAAQQMGLRDGQTNLDARLAQLACSASATLPSPLAGLALLRGSLPLAHLAVLGASGVLAGIAWVSPAVLVCLLQH